MVKKGKIPVATILGLFASGKRLWDYSSYLKTRTDLTDIQKQNAMFYKISGYDLETGVFDIKEAIGTFGPTVLGYGVSTYIGGPKGMNINSKLRAVPLFKV